MTKLEKINEILDLVAQVLQPYADRIDTGFKQGAENDSDAPYSELQAKLLEYIK